MWVSSDFDWFDDAESFGLGTVHDLYSENEQESRVLGADGQPMRKEPARHPIGFRLR